MDGPERVLGLRLGRLLAAMTGPSRMAPPLVLEPASAFEAVLLQRVVALETEVADLRGRVFGLVLLVVGGVLTGAVARFFG